ncbi:cobyric acid synthase [Bacillus aquiflavi]|uniref:Cobyric acid synthase n=1 Tax=Bacillus aquiflavi TaxID=2672567 RepID=A0A6B3VTA9_9BACI|nr:cobyric acid synthase [Bacillus aquiflavi]NEY81219.1 cobyric acid synthase [Bacillus aquiflavi]UAC49902.1 cobyric acid synthase [Bacillus aquiflavi]
MTGIMVQGTASHVGKSFIVAAFCRLLANEGVLVAPFKSQNMTNNIFVLKDKKEIGISQKIQAKAAKTEVSVEMNPILLKPNHGQVEVVLFGETTGTLSSQHDRDSFYENGLAAIETSLTKLTDQYEVLIMEGAGSPVELNLKSRELVNMKIAELADVPVLLVADIDKGGVFASVVGTIALLSKEERERIKGIIINKFYGDPAQFQEGIQLIEKKTGIPVLGVLPFVDRQLKQPEDYDIIANYVKNHLDWEQIKNLMFSWREK